MPTLVDMVLKDQFTSPYLDTTRNVKPDKPKGHLVDTPIYKAPYVYAQDLAKDTYGIVKGWQGKANDYELGKQNDIGMKLGGIAIAAYLTTIRPSKLPKLMEFIGAGSFFASLALWPKLAIALPLKLRTGVDIQQKYVDSYGRKKNFFQDTLYLPWDLYSKEQIKKMGDKMGVPYDVPNRDEVIKEKARKLAVQGNTLWLATAGFATPIMTGLICKGLEPVINNMKQKHDLKQAKKILDGQVALPSAKKQRQAFISFLTENMGKPLRASDELISKMNWSPVISPCMDTELKKDLAKILENVPNDVTHGYVDNLFKFLQQPFKTAGITKAEVIDLFEKNKVFGNRRDMGDVPNLIARYRAKNPHSFAVSLPEITHELLMRLAEGKKLPPDVLQSVKYGFSMENISTVVNVNDIKVLDKKTAGHLVNVFDELSKYFRQETVLRRWENAHYTPNADSLNAFSWKKSSDAILSALKFSPKEMELMTHEGTNVSKMVEAKIVEIAADPKRYKETVSKIAQTIAEYDAVMNESLRCEYRSYVDKMSKAAKDSLENLGFTRTARYIGGYDLVDAAGNIVQDASKAVNYREAMNGSLRNLRHTLYDERVLAQKSSMYRFIQALDLQRRFLECDFEAQFTEAIPMPDRKFFRPIYKDVKERARHAIMESTAADHAGKLGGKAKNGYKATMRLLYGALSPEYILERLETTLYKNNPDKINYVMAAFERSVEDGFRAAAESGCNKSMLARWRTGLSPDTIEALNDASDIVNKRLGLSDSKRVNLIDNMKRYFQTFIDKVVNAKSDFVRGFDLTEHNVSGAMDGLADSMSPSLKSSLIGSRPYEIVKGAAKETVSSRKWLKKFGIAGAVILAGTIIATTFFGHIPEKEMYMRDSKKGQ